MQAMAGYQIAETIYESPRTIVYRAIRYADQRPVILKVLHRDLPTPEELARFKLEYDILREFDSDLVVRAQALETHGGHLAIVMEDCNGESLAKTLARQRLDLPEALALALALTQALAVVHARHIVHKDLNPGNILWLPEARQVKVIDFGIASHLASEFSQATGVEGMAGTLAYIAPEQTGRMNRSVDFRADFYALGVTLYEVFTGRLPFNKGDPAELVHAHIAMPATPPALVSQAVPTTVSDIIVKLMDKMAENRYQSVSAILDDLRTCQHNLAQGQPFAGFAIGQTDRSRTLQISEKLYGRAQQTAELLRVCATMADGAATMVVVKGQAGIGKSALIGEVNAALIGRNGFFITGKFDQFKRDIPYDAFIQALRDLMKQIAGASSARIAVWKARLVEALGGNAGVITAVVPELEWIIGRQPEAPAIGPAETMLRFNLNFEKFIRVFAQPDNPVAFFLDDLQWADTASLNLLERLLLDRRNFHPFFIGAFRADEVSSVHPLMQTLDKFSAPACAKVEIELGPLGIADIAQLLADTLRCDPVAVHDLARVCFGKTAGNPFFVKQFIHRLHDVQLLRFDAQRNAWQWEMAQIEAAAITDNVADTISRRLHLLEVDALRAVTLAACIGMRFRLSTLAVVAGRGRVELGALMEAALQGGYILPLDDQYRLVRHDALADPAYRFLHDRVHQVAYAMVPEAEQARVHLAIGQELVRQAGAVACAEADAVPAADDIFEIVNHMNRGRALVDERAAREQLARLNLRACIKAKSASAYSAASVYGGVVIDLLGQTPWQHNPLLALQAHEECAEACALNGDFASAEQLVAAVLANTTDILDQVRSHHTRIQLSRAAQGRFAEAIDLGLAVLARLGFVIPRHPTLEDVMACQARIQALMGERTPEDFLGLPAMVDAHALAAIDILYAIFPCIMFGEPAMMPMYALEQVALSIRFGNAPKSAFGYIAYAIILSAGFNDSDAAYRTGRVAIELAHRPESLEVRAGTILMATYYTIFLKEPLAACKDVLYENFDNAYANGDLFTLGYGIVDNLVYRYFLGEDMEDIKRRSLDAINLVSKLNQQSCQVYARMTAQVFHNLTQDLAAPYVVRGELFDEDEAKGNYIAQNDFIGQAFLYFHKSLVACLFNAYDQAAAFFAEYEIFRPSVAGLYSYSQSFFYDSLIQLALFDRLAPEQRAPCLERVDANLVKLEGMATHAPMNYLHKVALIRAERCRVLAEAGAAMDWYDEAIRQAKQSGFVGEEAMANELAGRYWLQRGKRDFADIYLARAYYGYAHWGVSAKLHDMERKYPSIRGRAARRQLEETWDVSVSESATTTTRASERLDLISIMKATRAISGEIELNAVLAKVMQVMLENAGAQRCHFLLNQGGELVLEATLDAGATADIQRVRTPLALVDTASSSLCVTVVNYVFRSKEHCVLSATDGYGNFSHDACLQRTRPQSIMCLPLMEKGQLIGVLYFENNLLAEAFTKERIRVLEMLAVQAAVSLENAMLYAQLEQKVKDRTHELSNALDHLKKAQAQLVLSEKMAALGQLIAGVAHEVNTPLGAIRASATNIEADFEFVSQHLFRLPATLSADQHALYQGFLGRALEAEPVFDSRERRALRRTLTTELESQALDDASGLAEALTDIGLTSALEPYYPLLRSGHQQKMLQFAGHMAGVKRNNANIRLAVERASKVVFALKNFSRHDSAGTLQKFMLVDGIESTLTLYQNLLRRGVDVVRNYQIKPELQGYPDELNQVWTNIIHNALQAMASGGRLEIDVFAGEQHNVLVRFTDNGGGIADAILDRIFEPFFTTKPMGEGTGLGLHIAREIVHRHHGEISVQSVVGRTTFTVDLPL